MSHAPSQVKSPHVADAALQPFIQPNFNAADFLNSTLPPLTITGTRQEQHGQVGINELSTRTQAILSQLNAQTSQLSNALTQLTDEIIRSGSRLAYEVEILRGETIGLSDSLNETLKDDISKFQPVQAQDEVDVGNSSQATEDGEPEYIRKLRTLALVRSRLESVIKVFGDAMQWPLAPSELTSSFISVTGPEITPEENRSREEKGKEAAQRFKGEIMSLIQTANSTEEGVDAAIERVDELARLSLVWKGTSEEKVRDKFVESLSRMVEDEQKRLARRPDARRQGESLGMTMDHRYGESGKGVQDGGYGFMNNLKRFKGDIYLE